MAEAIFVDEVLSKQNDAEQLQFIKDNIERIESKALIYIIAECSQEVSSFAIKNFSKNKILLNNFNKRLIKRLLAEMPTFIDRIWIYDFHSMRYFYITDFSACYTDVNFFSMLIQCGLNISQNNLLFFKAMKFEAPWQIVQLLIEADGIEFNPSDMMENPLRHLVVRLHNIDQQMKFYRDTELMNLSCYHANNFDKLCNEYDNLLCAYNLILSHTIDLETVLNYKIDMTPYMSNPKRVGYYMIELGLITAEDAANMYSFFR